MAILDCDFFIHDQKLSNPENVDHILKNSYLTQAIEIDAYHVIKKGANPSVAAMDVFETTPAIRAQELSGFSPQKIEIKEDNNNSNSNNSNIGFSIAAQIARRRKEFEEKLPAKPVTSLDSFASKIEEKEDGSFKMTFGNPRKPKP